MNRHYSTVLAASLIVFLLVGCGQDNDTVSEATYTEKVNISYVDDGDDEKNIEWPDELLTERFTEYWHKRFAGEIDHVWAMEAPHFQFMAKPSAYRNYLARSQASLQNIEINDIKQISDYKYHVVCLITISRGGSDHKISFSDRWVKVDDVWYHLIRDPLIFPFSAS